MANIRRETVNSVNWVCSVCRSSSYCKILKEEKCLSNFVKIEDTGLFACNGCSVVFVDPLAFNKTKI